MADFHLSEDELAEIRESFEQVSITEIELLL